MAKGLLLFYGGQAYTYINRDQEVSAQMLVKREAPGFSVPIHVGNILLYSLIIQSEPHTIIIVDLWETSNRAEPCLPVTANRPLHDPQRLQNVCARVGGEILHVHTILQRMSVQNYYENEFGTFAFILQMPLDYCAESNHG